MDDHNKGPNQQSKEFIPYGANYWDRIIACRVPSLQGRREKYIDVNEQKDPFLISLFGSKRPGADQYLLHFAPGWDSNRNPVPVLLVHGAGTDANCFANLLGTGSICLQQRLTALGYRVFAITFAHSQGDNFCQAEQLAHAIEQIKELCQTARVDLLAYSKGGVAAYIYLADMGITKYRGDVTKYVMLGTPNMGTDFAFRNTYAGYMSYLNKCNAVVPWDKIMLQFGLMLDTAEQSIYHDGCFIGQSQLLYPWESEYALDPLQPDWYTTYHGGVGFWGHSRGIKSALEDGGHLIEKLEQRGIEPGVDLYILAGDKPFFGPTPTESSLVPGDGIVFLDSALNSYGMEKRGARLAAKTTFPCNHFQLLYDQNVARWINKQLTP